MDARAAHEADPLDILVGQRLRYFREKRNLTQRELAVRLGMTFQQIQKYENGKNRVAASKLWRLATELGVSVSALFVSGGADGEIGQPDTIDQAELLEAWATVTDSERRSAILVMIRSLAR